MRRLILNRARLDSLCRVPGCRPGDGHRIALRPPCHPRAGVAAFYSDGQVALLCRACGRHACSVEVAP